MDMGVITIVDVGVGHQCGVKRVMWSAPCAVSSSCWGVLCEQSGLYAFRGIWDQKKSILGLMESPLFDAYAVNTKITFTTQRPPHSACYVSFLIIDARCSNYTRACSNM
jgi:hypothetical protein